MKRKSPKPQDARTPIHLRDFGGVDALFFDKGGYARVQMESNEVEKFLGAMLRYVLRKQRIPDPKVLAALDTLQEFFRVGTGKGCDIRITADVVLARYGVSLDPILKQIRVDDRQRDA